ncbi:unnamed protein product [Gordionus sp. m RMFG-2023]
MEFKCVTINAQALIEKFNEKRGVDSGISDQTSISSSNLSVKSDSFYTIDKNDANRDLASIKDTVHSIVKPINSMFLMYKVVDKFINSAPALNKNLSLKVKFEIRNPYSNEIRNIYDWRKEEFGYRTHWDYFMSLYNCYPSGWIVAVDEKGKILGTIFAMNMNDNQAFGGLFAVKKSYRCHGIGGQLWKVRLNHIGNRNFGINALESRIGPNEKLGMKLAFRMSTYYGRLTTRVINAFKLKFSPKSDGYTFRKLSSMQENPQITQVNRKSLLRLLVDYDTQINTLPRSQFLEEAISHYEHTVTIVCTEDVTLIKNDNQIEELPKVVGYGMLKPTIEGYSIEPLYADSPAIAESILRHLLNHLTEPDILIDITIIDDCKKIPSKTLIGGLENNARLRCVKNIIANLGLELEYHLYRMYSKSDVSLPTNKVFAMNSSEAFSV